MACSSCGGNRTAQPTFNNLPGPGVSNVGSAMNNLIKAGAAQEKKLRWFRNGVKGLIKCIGHSTIYSEADICQNRQTCRECSYSTKQDGKLTTTSQCMYPDPKQGGAPCGCFILCKTQSDICPAKKFTTTPITISIDK